MQNDIEEIRKDVLSRGLNMNPPLPENEIKVYEDKWNIILPGEYKEFITQIGNGGEGPPEYGIDVLGAGPSDDTYWNFPDKYIERLGRPFPETTAVLWDGYEPESITNGLLYLGNDGCGMYWMLVVTGKAQGEMWQLAEDGIQPCAPTLTFLQWYKSWLLGKTDWWSDYQP